MRFQLEADAKELEAKAPELIKALAARLAPFCPELSEGLLKSIAPKRPRLKFPALRGTQAEARKVYGELMRAMIAEIVGVMEVPQHHDHTARIAFGKSEAAAGTIHTWKDGQQWQKHPDGQWLPVGHPGAAQGSSDDKWHRFVNESIKLAEDAKAAGARELEPGRFEVGGKEIWHPTAWGDGAREHMEGMDTDQYLEGLDDALAEHKKRAGKTREEIEAAAEAKIEPGAPWHQTMAEYTGGDYSKRAEWDDSTRRAVAQGYLPPNKAGNRGWYPGGSEINDWKPLPPKLFHVTTAKSAVEQSGQLKTRDELGMRRGVGLGGGPQDTISTTSKREDAEQVLRAMHEAHDVLNGRLTPDEMMRQAEAGTGARKPWANELREYLKHSTPINGISPASFYGVWSTHRYFTGKGHPPIAFFQTDHEALKNTDPNEIALVELKSKPHAVGIYDGDPGEIRVPYGDLLEIQHIGRPKAEESSEGKRSALGKSSSGGSIPC